MNDKTEHIYPDPETGKPEEPKIELRREQGFGAIMVHHENNDTGKKDGYAIPEPIGIVSELEQPHRFGEHRIAQKLL